MQSQNPINLKPLKRKSSHLLNISIVKRGNNYIAFATILKGGSLPLRVGTLSQVIEEAEHCSAYWGLPVDHSLTPQITLMAATYWLIDQQWVWVRRQRVSFIDAHQAYLQLRKNNVKVSQLEAVTESDTVRQVYTCSQHCTVEWGVVLYRLNHEGQVPETHTVGAGVCPRCFSHFVKSQEGGKMEMCLNCGYE
jgi:hypothetical protein